MFNVGRLRGNPPFDIRSSTLLTKAESQVRVSWRAAKTCTYGVCMESRVARLTLFRLENWSTSISPRQARPLSRGAQDGRYTRRVQTISLSTSYFAISFNSPEKLFSVYCGCEKIREMRSMMDWEHSWGKANGNASIFASKAVEHKRPASSCMRVKECIFRSRRRSITLS